MHNENMQYNPYLMAKSQYSL